MKNKYKTFSLRLITAMMLVSLTLVGSDCEDIINQITQSPCETGQINGTWTLIYNAGSTNDICPGEVVEFPSQTGGTATLQCPGGTAIKRLYNVQTISNVNYLTYTETGVEYEVNFTENCELVLTGTNNNRQLYYTAGTPAENPDVPMKTEKNSVNSSSLEEVK
jgi:hypothetical protein